MKTKSLTFLLALTFLFLFSGSVFGDDFQDARDAIDKEDYKTAHQIFLKLAKKGHVEAQFNLALIYDLGKGVPKNHKEAVKWYRLAAEQGLAEAQLNLGVNYGLGRGVPQDYVLAHMWHNLAGSNGNEIAIKMRNILAKEMTPQQLEKAQEMARNWKPKK